MNLFGQIFILTYGSLAVVFIVLLGTAASRVLSRFEPEPEDELRHQEWVALRRLGEKVIYERLSKEYDEVWVSYFRLDCTFKGQVRVGDIWVSFNWCSGFLEGDDWSWLSVEVSGLRKNALNPKALLTC